MCNCGVNLQCECKIRTVLLTQFFPPLVDMIYVIIIKGYGEGLIFNLDPFDCLVPSLVPETAVQSGEKQVSLQKG